MVESPWKIENPSYGVVFQGHIGKPVWEAQVSTHVVGFLYPLHGHYLPSSSNMFTSIGKFFASIVVGVSSILGIHHSQETQPISVPPVVSEIKSVSTSTSISTQQKVSIPAKPVKTQITAQASVEIKPVDISSSQPQTSNTSSTPTPTPVTVTAPVVVPVEIPKPVVVPSPEVKVIATPSSIAYNGESTISWIATNALSCTLGSSPVLLAASGSQSVSPTDPQADWSKVNEKTYTVSCTGTGGSASGEATVSVQSWVPPTGYRVSPACGTATLRASCITGPNGGAFCGAKGDCSWGG